MQKILSTLLVSVFTLVSAFAQNAGSPDFMRSTGKIYVVVGVLVMTFVGIVAFLVHIERRLKKLEQEGE
jgi:CcmD family protein